MSSVDLLAQQVEHIPFKDGVLGSSPRQITYKEAKKWQRTDKSSQYQQVARIFLYVCWGESKNGHEKTGFSAPCTNFMNYIISVFLK